MHDLIALKAKAHEAPIYPHDTFPMHQYLSALQAEFEAGRLQHVPVDLTQASQVVAANGREITAEALIRHIAETLVAKGAGLLTTEPDSFGQILIEYVAAADMVDPTSDPWVDIRTERLMQQRRGYDTIHDAAHDIGELIASDWGAKARLENACVHAQQGRMEEYRKALVQAGALVIAELDRLNEEAKG